MEGFLTVTVKLEKGEAYKRVVGRGAFLCEMTFKGMTYTHICVFVCMQCDVIQKRFTSFVGVFSCGLNE